MKSPLLFFVIISILVISSISAQQTTAVTTESVKIYADSAKEDSNIGELNEGVVLTTFGNDKTGKYARVTLEFYIPIESIQQLSYFGKVGDIQNANDASYKLVDAVRDANSVQITLQVSNKGVENMDFVALMLIKLSAQHNNSGDLDPFKSNNSFVSIKPGETVTADLFYNFENMPENVTLSCTSYVSGKRVLFSLGF